MIRHNTCGKTANLFQRKNFDAIFARVRSGFECVRKS